MLQKTVYKSRALTAGVCIVAALLILSVFPLRLWRKTVTFEGTGKPLVMSEQIDTLSDVSQVFVAQYDRLGSVDIYVADIGGGRYMEAELRSADGEVLCHRFIDMAEFEVPGYVRMAAGVETKPGQQYRIYMKGRFSAFRLGLEPVSANPVPYMGAFFNQYDPHPGLRLQMAANYDVPWGKWSSLLLMIAFFLVAYALCMAVRAWYKKHPERDVLLLEARIVERTLYVVAGAFYLTLFVLNFPLKKFNDSAGEIFFLGAGIVMAAAATVYAIRRFCTEPERTEKMPLKDIAASFFMALSIAYACEYMNAVSNLMHDKSSRQLFCCLLVVILLSFRTDMLVNRLNVLWGVISGCGAAWYILTYAAHAQTTEEAQQNTVMRCNALIVMLLGFIVISALRSIIAKVWKVKKPSFFGYLTLALSVCLLIFSGTRETGIYLLLLFAVLYICVGCNIPHGRFIRILIWGVNINFVMTVGYCLLFRAYQAYIFTRYGMVFHTVAITGEYLASIALIAAAQLLLRMAKDGEQVRLRERIDHAWRELLLFGICGVYAIFTVSRTAYLTIAVGILVLLFVFCIAWAARAGGGRAGAFAKRFLFSTAAMLVSCALMFPGVFAMQRILPAINGRHRAVSFVEKDSMVHDILGTARWDSNYYISGIRFWSIFRARILRLPELVFFFAEDKYNFNENHALLYSLTGEAFVYDEEGNWVNQDAVAPEEYATDARSGKEEEPVQDGTEQTVTVPEITEATDETGENTVEISNGRLDIFRTYFSRIGLKGHDVLYTEDPYYIHAHNSYLQVMYTNGIPTGLLFTCWVLCAIGYPLVCYRKSVVGRADTKEADAEEDAYLVTAASSLAFAFAGLTEMNFQLCNPMCMLLLTGLMPVIFRRENAAC